MRTELINMFSILCILLIIPLVAEVDLWQLYTFPKDRARFQPEKKRDEKFKNGRTMTNTVFNHKIKYLLYN